MSIFSVIILFLILTLSPPSGGSVIPDGSEPSTMTCNSCCQGQAGIPGIPGSAGIPGAPGGFGPQGPVGSKGDVGLPGLSVKGERGEVGPMSLPGPQGQPGPPGKVGPVGIQGPVGPKGEVGQPGLSVKGEKGVLGEVGFLGPQGPRGETGLRGPKGNVGPVGIQGPRGIGGFKGAAGNPGPKGESGVRSFAGFTVVKTTTQTGPGIVTFDTVTSDIAGDYDTNTHKFTCSIPGFYLFTFTIGSKDNNHPYVKLVKNGNLIVRVNIHPSSTSANIRNMGTNSALLQMAAGDQVWLVDDENTELYSSSGWKWTSFTGVLMHAM